MQSPSDDRPSPQPDSSPTDSEPRAEEHASKNTQPHADKYNDPRVKITTRGILIGVAIVVLGFMGSLLSIWARRTQLEKSTEFWGDEIIAAYQLAEEVELHPSLGTEPTAPQTEEGQPTAEPSEEKSEQIASSATKVRLSGMPGLGHLRHVLLDDRSYQWDSISSPGLSIDQSPPTQTEGLMVLKWTDPTANRFPDIEIAIDTDEGWVGVLGGERKVRLNERYRNAVPTYLKRIADFEPIRVENRKDRTEDEEG
ncbi:hypothetical protein LOC67_08660 [Stieleria sp. JC731]|uniref:hypothetical protein n=1 Tax=Pirellulaceae TaxID=2691357 RepID=UPI001E428539|nr:hypothetical protein [Stieleria sp. JC731]MCC9600631.1 hypothetical protein [Stieleria sp. JC731]